MVYRRENRRPPGSDEGTNVLIPQSSQTSAEPDRPLTLGVVGSSLKPDELRAPLHPEDLERIPESHRRRMIVEEGYGDRFGMPDAEIAKLGARIGSRRGVISEADIVLLPKPQHEDLRQMGDGRTLWGWVHCVQDRTLTQLAIDKRLTLIAFEAMNHWNGDGTFGLHVFHTNNELAGYCSVLHALQLIGSTGNYGRRLRATVIGFGSTARGAVVALRGIGITDITVLTGRDVAAVASPIHTADMLQLEHGDRPFDGEVITDEGRAPLAEFLAESDVVVNCTLQNPNAPLMYLQEEDLGRFRPGSLIIDVSCDEGMGFSWARPTSFADPVRRLANNTVYYAVDHTPSYLWNSASWENSAATLPFVETVMAGPSAWARDTTIARAIEIRGGEIVNPAILEFQGRSEHYPHPAA